MAPISPADALGPHSPGVRDLVVEVVRSRHNHSAEAHQAAKTQYSMGFGSQWRDLLDDTHDAFAERGFQSHKLTPGGYKVPVVNDCLVYVWRVPDAVDAISLFASTPTRKNGFTATPPDPMLFEPSFTAEPEPNSDVSEEAELERLVKAVGDTMPLVLVMVQSSPRQLHSVEWAIASLGDDGKVELHGQQAIWEAEPKVGDAVSDVESFDSGAPIAPSVEPQKQAGPLSDV